MIALHLGILPETIKPYKVEDDSKTEDYQPIATFEVRGCELAEFEPRVSFGRE